MAKDAFVKWLRTPRTQASDEPPGLEYIELGQARELWQKWTLLVDHWSHCARAHESRAERLAKRGRLREAEAARARADWCTERADSAQRYALRFQARIDLLSGPAS